MITEMIMSVLEMTGTIAFAISGALVAIGCGLDIFGVVFVGGITAFGGGMVRDMLLGIAPVSILSRYPVFLVAAVTSLCVFAIAYINKSKFKAFREKAEQINNFFDAVGLAAFSVTGTQIACSEGFSANAFAAIVMGMLTGVGGGIFRDVLTDTTPFVFKKHIYALASIFGSAVYYIIARFTDETVTAAVAAIPLVIVLRMLAAKFRWGLPRIDTENKD